MAVAVLAREPTNYPGRAQFTESAKSISLHSASGEAVLHSVVLVGETEWHRPNPTTLVAPRSLGGMLAMRIFEKTRNLDLATEVQDYDGILGRKFELNVDYARLINDAASDSNLTRLLQEYKFDEPQSTSSVNLPDVWRWMERMKVSSVVPSPIPAMLPVLLAFSGGNETRMRDICKKIFPQNKRAFDEIVLSVRSVCNTEADLGQVIQSSIEMLRFGPWSGWVLRLQSIFLKPAIGGGLNSTQKTNLKSVLDGVSNAVNAVSLIMNKIEDMEESMADEISKSMEQNPPMDADVLENLAQTLRQLTT